MSDTTVANAVRSLRMRLGWTQSQLGVRSRTSKSTVARVEHGDVGAVTVERVRRIMLALGGRLDIVPRWNEGDLDRLLRKRHSAMHELVAASFANLPEWQSAPEVSFSIYGERGVIDLLAWHAGSSTLLIVELKTELTDVNELMAKADQRRRLATRIVADRGWRPAVVAVWIVVADSRTNRRRLAAHRRVLRSAFPTDGRSVNRWLRHPMGPIAALSFLSNDHAVTSRKGLARQRRVRGHSARRMSAAAP
jgi:transcriptional regulator with XRE-family HTH domain